MADLYYYDYGLPFTRELAENLDNIIKDVENNKPGLLIIDGGVGNGKTTLGVHAGDYLNGAYRLDRQTGVYLRDESKFLDLSVQMSMGGKQFQEKLQMTTDSKKKVLVYDEAGDFNRRGALSKLNSELNRIFETYRAFKVILIVILPSAGSLDKELFKKNIVQGTLHCFDRQKNYGYFSGYSPWLIMYVLDKMRKLIVPQLAYSRTTPNFFGVFKNLPPERAKALETISTKGKKEILNKNVIKNKGLIVFDEILAKAGVQSQYIRKFIRENNIQYAESLHHKRYYDKNDADFILKAMEERKKVKQLKRRDLAQ